MTERTRVCKLSLLFTDPHCSERAATFIRFTVKSLTLFLVQTCSYEVFMKKSINLNEMTENIQKHINCLRKPVLSFNLCKFMRRWMMKLILKQKSRWKPLVWKNIYWMKECLGCIRDSQSVWSQTQSGFFQTCKYFKH